MSFIPFIKRDFARVFLLIMALIPLAVRAQFTVAFSNGQATITGYTGSGGAVVIPPTINGDPVTAIAPNAFGINFTVTSVTIPDSVTSIGASAFANSRNLASVTLPSGLTSIASGTFSTCALTSINLPNSLTSIGASAFQACAALTSVTIPSGVTSIGDQAFDYCSNLSSITVAAPNAYFSSVNGVLFNGDQTTLIQFPGGAAGAYAIPSTVTSIKNFAFDNSRRLTGVTMSNGVSSIGSGMFQFCPLLASVTLSDNITSIEDGAFDGTNLTSVTIPASVTSIGSYVFYQCANLASATFEGNAPAVGTHTFYQSASNFTVEYYDGAIGFFSPVWADSSDETFPTVDLGDAPSDLFAGVIIDANLKQSSWFGYYNYASYPIVYHFNLGWEYVYDAGDGVGVYLFDYTSGHFWYTNPTWFPYIYDFSLNAYLYYYAGSGSPRYFYDFGTDQMISE